MSAPATTTTTTTSATSLLVAQTGATGTQAASGETSGVTAGELSLFAALATGGDQPPAALIPVYRAAASRYGIPWEILAAINSIETDYGRDLDVSSAGAIGWMQFMPATWQEYGLDADGAGSADPYNARDAIFAAARLLSANGASHNLRGAIFAYNHAEWYVDEVLWLAQEIADRGVRPSSGASARIVAMRSTASMLDGFPYVWGGGHAGWVPSAGYDCSGFVSAVLHAAGYLTTPATTQTLASERGILSGPGRYVTILDRTDAATITDDHVIIDIDGQWWESGGAGGGARVHRIASPSPTYLATFNLILHPRGL